MMAKSTIQYLIDNNLTPELGLEFTCNDYYYIMAGNYKHIIINRGKGIREEKLIKQEIVLRIDELQKFVNKFEGTTICKHLDTDSIKRNILDVEINSK